jgi:SAM-dependent methyltransferase
MKPRPIPRWRWGLRLLAGASHAPVGVEAPSGPGPRRPPRAARGAVRAWSWPVPAKPAACDPRRREADGHQRLDADAFDVRRHLDPSCGDQGRRFAGVERHNVAIQADGQRLAEGIGQGERGRERDPAMATPPGDLEAPSIRRHDMARIPYDDQTAAAFKAVREVPRAGLGHWRAAIRRHLSPSPGMTVADIGAGTGAFAAAFRDWFGLNILAVEPSAAMRAQIPRRPGIQVLAGDASALPLPDGMADGVWLSLVIHHLPDLEAAAREIRRVLRPGASVLIRQGFPGRLERVELVRWFPETARAVATYPSVEQTCQAFAAAGFRRDALEPIPEIYPTSLAAFLAQVDTLRRADTTMRALTEAEFQRGKARLRRAVQAAEATASPEPRSNWLDLLVLR